MRQCSDRRPASLSCVQGFSHICLQSHVHAIQAAYFGAFKGKYFKAGGCKIVADTDQTGFSSESYLSCLRRL